MRLASTALAALLLGCPLILTPADALLVHPGCSVPPAAPTGHKWYFAGPGGSSPYTNPATGTKLSANSPSGWATYFAANGPGTATNDTGVPGDMYHPYSDLAGAFSTPTGWTHPLAAMAVYNHATANGQGVKTYADYSTFNPSSDSTRLWPGDEILLEANNYGRVFYQGIASYNTIPLNGVVVGATATGAIGNATLGAVTQTFADTSTHGGVTVAGGSIQSGYFVFGTGIPSGDKVSTVNGTSVTLTSAPTTGYVSGEVLVFSTSSTGFTGEVFPFYNVDGAVTQNFQNPYKIGATQAYGNVTFQPTGNIDFVWMHPDIAGGANQSNVIIQQLAVDFMNGLIVQGVTLSSLQPLQSFAELVKGSGTWRAPQSNVIFDQDNFAGWPNGASRTWDQTIYPNSQGSSDGTGHTRSFYDILGHLGVDSTVSFTTATANANSTALTFPVPSQVSSIVPGWNVTGTGIATGTTVSAISGLAVTLSANTIAAIANGTVKFSDPTDTTVVGSGTVGAFTITVTSVPAAVKVGWRLTGFGSGVGNGDVITAINGNVLTVSLANTVTTNNATFSVFNPNDISITSSAASGSKSLAITTVPSQIFPGQFISNASIPRENSQVVSVSGQTATLAGPTSAAIASGATITVYNLGIIVPAGSWTQSDWSTIAPQSGIVLIGQQWPLPPGQLDSNDFGGATCDSITNSMFRWLESSEIGFSGANMGMVANNKFAFSAADAVDFYSSNNMTGMNNYMTTPTAGIGHPDAFQMATAALSAIETAHFQGPIIIGNEIHSNEHADNYFPIDYQGINGTDENWDNAYVANNILVIPSGHGIGFNGIHDVLVNNTELWDGSLGTSVTGITMGVGNAARVNTPGTPCPAGVQCTWATYAYIANNISNSFGRGASGGINPCTINNDVWANNIAVGGLNNGAFKAQNSNVCVGTVNTPFDNTTGQTDGIYINQSIDYRSSQATPGMFMSFNPPTWTPSPTGTNPTNYAYNPIGSIDLHLNPAWVGPPTAYQGGQWSPMIPQYQKDGQPRLLPPNVGAY